MSDQNSKVDVHHHIIPPELAGNNFGMKGMNPPTWTLAADKAFSEANGIRTRIFSVSTPGVSHIADPNAAAALARSFNEYCAALRDTDPDSYGFFATVPSLEYPDLALGEIRYALDTLRADGVTFFTSYGGKYLGAAEFAPIWAELNAREAVVFVHPADRLGATRFNEKIPGPAFDWPHETGRTAMDMILNGRLHQFPRVKIILSHAGGTLPTLARRATLVAQPEFGAAMSAEDILGQARMFYFDLALSGSPEVLPLILGFAARGHVLYGSDFPHATVPVSEAFTRFVEEFRMDEEVRREVWHGAAEKLFPRLKGKFE